MTNDDLNNRMVSTTIYLRRKQLNALEKLANMSEVPKARLIRRGVNWVIEDMERKFAVLEMKKDDE